MNDKTRNDVIPGVGCDVTNCKYNTIDCRCSASKISVQNEKANTKARPTAPPSVPAAAADFLMRLR